MTEAVRPASAGARAWVEARTLAAHAHYDEQTVVAAINDGRLTGYRINKVLLVPAAEASDWLGARGSRAGDPPVWDPDRQAAQWRAGNNAVASANLLTVAQAAEVMGVTPNRVYGVIRTRRMVGRIVNGRIWVDPADIVDYQVRYPPRVVR